MATSVVESVAMTRCARAPLRTVPSALEATAQGVARRWWRRNSERSGGELEEEEAARKRQRPASSQRDTRMDGPAFHAAGSGRCIT